MRDTAMIYLFPGGGMKLLKFLLRKMFDLLVFLVGVVLIVWLLWSVLVQIDFNFFRKRASFSELPSFTFEKKQNKIESKSGDSSEAAENRATVSPATLQQTSAGVEKNQRPALKAQDAGGGTPSDTLAENTVVISADVLKINGIAVMFSKLMEFLDKADKKTKVYFLPGYSEGIYECVKRVNNKHILILFDNR